MFNSSNNQPTNKTIQFNQLQACSFCVSNIENQPSFLSAKQQGCSMRPVQKCLRFRRCGKWKCFARRCTTSTRACQKLALGVCFQWGNQCHNFPQLLQCTLPFHLASQPCFGGAFPQVLLSSLAGFCTKIPLPFSCSQCLRKSCFLTPRVGTFSIVQWHFAHLGCVPLCPSQVGNCTFGTVGKQRLWTLATKSPQRHKFRQGQLVAHCRFAQIGGKNRAWVGQGQRPQRTFFAHVQIGKLCFPHAHLRQTQQFFYLHSSAIASQISSTVFCVFALAGVNGSRIENLSKTPFLYSKYLMAMGFS